MLICHCIKMYHFICHCITVCMCCLPLYHSSCALFATVSAYVVGFATVSCAGCTICHYINLKNGRDNDRIQWQVGDLQTICHCIGYMATICHCTWEKTPICHCILPLSAYLPLYLTPTRLFATVSCTFSICHCIMNREITRLPLYDQWTETRNTVANRLFSHKYSGKWA